MDVITPEIARFRKKNSTIRAQLRQEARDKLMDTQVGAFVKSVLQEIDALSISEDTQEYSFVETEVTNEAVDILRQKGWQVTKETKTRLKRFSCGCRHTTGCDHSDVEEYEVYVIRW